jgi:hypothetical protein
MASFVVRQVNLQQLSVKVLFSCLEKSILKLIKVRTRRESLFPIIHQWRRYRQ